MFVKKPENIEASVWRDYLARQMVINQVSFTKRQQASRSHLSCQPLYEPDRQSQPHKLSQQKTEH